MVRTLERYALSSFDVLGSLPEEIATEVLKEFEVKELLELGLVSESEIWTSRPRRDLIILLFLVFLSPVPGLNAMASSRSKPGSVEISYPVLSSWRSCASEGT